MKIKLYDVSRMPSTAYYYTALLSVVYNYISSDMVRTKEYEHLLKLSEATTYYAENDDAFQEEKELKVDAIENLLDSLPKDYESRMDAIIYCLYLCFNDSKEYVSKVNYNSYARKNNEVIETKKFRRLPNFRKIELIKRTKADIHKQVENDMVIYSELIKTNLKKNHFGNIMFEKICEMDKIEV